MDPVTISLLLAGTGANVMGGIFGRNDALENAQRQAEARNASLRQNIGLLNGFADQNRGVFDGNMAHYAPTTQQASLDKAQTTRGDANAANIKASDPNAVPLAAGSSPASRSDLAKRMLEVHDAATSRAQSLGKLGGYGDAWLNNELGNQQAKRDIGVTNNYAEGRKALVQPEADLAGAAAYKAPSIWGPLLQGAGSLLTAGAGAGAFGGAGGATAGAPWTAQDTALNNQLFPGYGTGGPWK